MTVNKEINGYQNDHSSKIIHDNEIINKVRVRVYLSSR